MKQLILPSAAIVFATCVCQSVQAGDAPPATHADVAYGPDTRNVLDFWQAKGEGPRPVLVYIHGGGWRGGNKQQVESNVQPYLDNGISVASIEYRLTPANPLPAPIHDAARAIQFLRSKATQWQLDKTRIAVQGTSAGACTSMWLLMHDDLAEPDSADPVLRESTRVLAAVGIAGQTSIDPKQIVPWLGPKVLDHLMIANAVGEATSRAALDNYEEHRADYLEFSAYNHVSKGDGALLMIYKNDMTLPSKDAGHGIHHPVYGVKMKEKCDSADVECHLLIPEVSTPEKYRRPYDFLVDKLLTR